MTQPTSEWTGGRPPRGSLRPRPLPHAAARGTFLLAFSVLALTLILTGVIGGVLASGVFGLFIGPVLLAVGWTLVTAWVADIDRTPQELEESEKR